MDSLTGRQPVLWPDFREKAVTLLEDKQQFHGVVYLLNQQVVPDSSFLTRQRTGSCITWLIPSLCTVPESDLVLDLHNL